MAILATLAGWAVLLALGGALLWLPGAALRAALAAWAGPRDPALGAPDGALGALLDSLGLSLAFWPLLLLYAALVHIPVTPRTVAAVLAVAAVGLAALLWRRARRGPWGRPAVGAAARAMLPLAALTALALVVRFAAVRDLVLPNWGDSFHHTLITQLFLNQQGIPQGYMPYAPVYSFTYHFGFHGLAALWALLAAVPSWSAVLTIGQILNALAVPAAYVLTRELFRTRWAALASAVVVGFLSGMPAAYVDWGRYTQLAGQVLLPFVLVWLIRWLELPPATPWRAGAPRLALAGFGAAGLGLTHYRVLIMYALFVLAYLAIRGLAIARDRGPAALPRRARLAVLAGRAVAVGALGGLLFAPWLGNLLAEYLPGLVHRLGAATASYVQEYTPDTFLTAYVGLLLPLLAALGVGLVLWQGPGRARVMVAVLLAWTGLLALSARPDVVHLPGVGAMGTFTIGIALYLPLGTLAGPGIARPLIALRAWLRARRPPLRLPRGLVEGALLGAALALALANPGYWTTDPAWSYVTPDDLRALTWVAGHTPPDARFLISAASSYSGRAVTATDAGMWLPLWAGGGRQTSVPPLSSAAEGAQAADLADRVQALYQATLRPTLAGTVALLQRDQISYVFLGEHTATISAAALRGDPADYCLLFRQGESYVFGLRGSVATPCR